MLTSSQFEGSKPEWQSTFTSVIIGMKCTLGQTQNSCLLQKLTYDTGYDQHHAQGLQKYSVWMNIIGWYVGRKYSEGE